MTHEVDRPEFWEALYQKGSDGWQLDEEAPALDDLLAKRPPGPKGGRVAVLGCGRGHDARRFARAGYRVTGFDFAETAIQDARSLALEEGLEMVFEREDVFRIADVHPGEFDLAWERRRGFLPSCQRRATQASPGSWTPASESSTSGVSTPASRRSCWLATTLAARSRAETGKKLTKSTPCEPRPITCR